MYHQWPQADTQLCSGRGPSCQSTRQVSRSWANPVLQTTAPASRLLFSYPGHSVLSETETLPIQPHNRIYEQFAWCRTGNSPVPYSWIIHLPAAPGCHLPAADTSQLEPSSHLNTAGMYFSDELWTGHLSTQGCWLVWFSRAALWPRAGSVTEYGHCPESQRGKSQHRSSSSSPWGAPVQQMRLILTACCTFLLQLSL